jgi:hypothetical protein
VLKKKEEAPKPKVKKDPVYCTGNFNAKATLASFSEDNSLLASDWKTNSLNYFYFDCDKRKKDFKLDAAKVEKGQYSEEEMKLVGKSEGSCCEEKSYEFDLSAPRVQQYKIDLEGLITVTFN